MFDFVKQLNVIDIQDLNEVEGLEGILDDLSNWRGEGFGQDTYITIDKDYLEEIFCEFICTDDDNVEELAKDAEEKYPCLFKVLQLMNSGDLPQEFIILIWW